MRLEERRTIRVVLGLVVLGAIGAVLLPVAIYVFGLSVAPPRPVAETSRAPQVVLDALWARAGGGTAAELRPVSHLALAQLAACIVQAEGRNDNERMAHCRHVLPAMPALEYLSNLHIKDAGIERNSFTGGHGALATTVWMSRSWTREEFLNTLAARGQVGFGWRGIATGASRYFGKQPSALTLSEAAYIASRIGEDGDDPWCHPKTAVLMRNRILGRMRDNGAITADDFERASTAPLEFVAAPEGRPPCSK